MEASRLNTGLDVLDQTECARLLATETVGRLGVVVDDEPQDLPSEILRWRDRTS